MVKDEKPHGTTAVNARNSAYRDIVAARYSQNKAIISIKMRPKNLRKFMKFIFWWELSKLIITEHEITLHTWYYIHGKHRKSQLLECCSAIWTILRQTNSYHDMNFATTISR